MVPVASRLATVLIRKINASLLLVNHYKNTICKTKNGRGEQDRHHNQSQVRYEADHIRQDE
jgi:hypothetical protein